MVVISGSIIIPPLTTDLSWYSDAENYDLAVHQLFLKAGNNESAREIQVRAGILRRVDVRIPYGHGALARLQIWDQARQVVPTEADHWIKGNQQDLRFELNWEIQGPPHSFTLKGWSEDDSYPHRFYCDFHIATAEDRALVEGSGESSLGERILGLFGA